MNMMLCYYTYVIISLTLIATRFYAKRRIPGLSSFKWYKQNNAMMSIVEAVEPQLYKVLSVLEWMQIVSAIVVMASLLWWASTGIF